MRRRRTPRLSQPPVRAADAAPGSEEERQALLDALSRTQENVTLTAQELGVSRVTLYRMLRRHAISLNRGLREAPVAGRRPTAPLDAGADEARAGPRMA